VCRTNLVPVDIFCLCSSMTVATRSFVPFPLLPPWMNVSIIVDLPPTKRQVVADRQMSIVNGHVVYLCVWLYREAEKVSYFGVICIGNFNIEVW
jgi:hypothetical protein